jgi:hypothetical protein
MVASEEYRDIEEIGKTKEQAERCQGKARAGKWGTPIVMLDPNKGYCTRQGL